jgi:hypothetical protein
VRDERRQHRQPDDHRDELLRHCILGQRDSGDDDCDLASTNDREAEALSRGC